MPKSTLESAIQKAASDFALTIVEAVKGSTLDELMALQGETPKRRGRKPGRPKKKAKPGPKPKKKVGRPPKAKTATRKKPGPKPKAKSAATKKSAANKKRSINYPKCAYPGCKNNRYARGKGFCGDHFKEFKAGKIAPADSYSG